jgi:ferritin
VPTYAGGAPTSAGSRLKSCAKLAFNRSDRPTKPRVREAPRGGDTGPQTNALRGAPMISNDMAARINAQINREMYSAYFYLGLSAQAETMNLKGTAAWFMAKHAEELDHGLKMYRYLIDQDASVHLTEVAEPPVVDGGILAMFERTLSHEREVTGAINDMVDHALSEKDHATNIFLQWFVTEQIEEEATVNDIIGRLRLFGDQGQGLLMIDNELAKIAAKIGQGPAPAAVA